MLPKVRPEMPNSLKTQLREAFEKRHFVDMQYEEEDITTPAKFITKCPFVASDALARSVESNTCEKSSDLQADVPGQLEFLIKKVGFNISQLADLLKVGRQSIYKWRDGTDVRKENLYRLDVLYSVFKSWDNTFPVKLGSYLYKRMAGSKSLYDLLSDETIDVEKAENVAVKINHILLDYENRASQRRKKLQDAGFKPVSKEQKDKVLNNLIRKS